MTTGTAITYCILNSATDLRNCATFFNVARFFNTSWKFKKNPI